MTELLLHDFEEEMKSTRKVLERVPSDKGEWKPHPKSFSLAHLARLVSWMPGWIGQTLRETALDLKQAGGYSNEKTETLVAGFDKVVESTRAAIAAAKDEDFDVEWSLKMGDQVVMKNARRIVVRQHLMHLSHHRGELMVYLRLLDVPLPAVYGPTADERW